MPDNDNLLGETPEVWTGSEEKKGAPVLDMADLDDLLGDEPQVWTGDTQRKGAPVLEDEVLLDEPNQSWNDQKLGAPVLDEQVQLDTPGASYVQESPKGDVQLDVSADDLLGGESAAYDEVAEFCQRLQFDDNLKATFMQLDAEKQQQVVEMRAGQLGIPAPMIPNALRPKAEESLPEAADVQLEEAPQPEEYVPQFKDEELERIKAESKKPQRYVPPQVELTAEKKKENIRIMNELREEREREQAHKGFITLIILTVIGVIGAACFSVYLAGMFGLGYKPEVAESWMSKVTAFAPILGVIMGVSALVLAAPVPPLKGIAKFLFGLGFVLTLFPGIPLLSQKDGSGAVNGVLLGVSAICCLAVVVVLSVSDGVNMYNKHGNS